MKPSFKITTTILAGALAVGLASAQSPSIIQNTRATMNGVRDNAAAASNAALAMSGDSAPSAAQAKQASGKAVSVSMAPAAGTKAAATKVVSVKPAKKAAPAKAAKEKADPMAAKAPAAASTPAPAEAAASASGDKPAGDEQASSDATKWTGGKRDPFISPVVSRAGGSGCNTGKKCLDIGAINLRGIVHSEAGFIAVVSNGLNKAYFLRENDPVFNGYVMKITEDSIVFQETVQDRLGKTFTREVVKKITTPAV